MILSRNASLLGSLFLGGLGALAALPPGRAAAADRCAVYGADLVDLGNGVCGRVMGHVRIHAGIPSGGTQSAAVNAWTGGATSSAELRNYDPAMLPNGAVTQHLRVHGSLDSFSPFR